MEHHDKDPEADEAGTSSPERGHGHKKRKRSAVAAADEIDALLDDAIGWKEHSGPGTGAYACEVQANLALKQGRDSLTKALITIDGLNLERPLM